MLKQSTVNQLRALNLATMADAAKAIDESGQASKLTKEDYVSLLVERLYEEKMTRKLANLIAGAHMEVPGAFLQDLCTDADRHLDPHLIARLATCEYISKGHNVIILAAAGGGKSYMASALANAACRQFKKTLCVNCREMIDELLILREDADKHKKKVKALSNVALLVCDDWLLSDKTTAQDVDELLAVVDGRTRAKKSTIICTQYRIEGWPRRMGEYPAADSVVDRIKNNAYVVNIEGAISMRERFMDEELKGSDRKNEN